MDLNVFKENMTLNVDAFYNFFTTPTALQPHTDFTSKYINYKIFALKF